MSQLKRYQTQATFFTSERWTWKANKNCFVTTIGNKEQLVVFGNWFTLDLDTAFSWAMYKEIGKKKSSLIFAAFDYHWIKGIGFKIAVMMERYHRGYDIAIRKVVKIKKDCNLLWVWADEVPPGWDSENSNLEKYLDKRQHLQCCDTNSLVCNTNTLVYNFEFVLHCVLYM